jgi:hypothetical protein
MPSQSKFTISDGPNGHLITDSKTGDTGEVYRQGESYLVRITSSKEKDERKLLARAKRMQSWYFQTQVKQTASKE